MMKIDPHTSYEEGKPMTDSHLPASKRTIMVVDDNQDIVIIVTTILEAKGYVVQSASSGQEALSLLKGQKPDLIILDIMMPQMDGLEVLTRLKADQSTASIPVILLTAKIQENDIIAGYKAGAEYYITKPFTPTQVLEGINLILGRDQGRSVESL
jgi:DNA-binding response OmpR family regulator